jgi:hypothetical protein
MCVAIRSRNQRSWLITTTQPGNDSSPASSARSDFEGARRVLEGTAKRIRKYAGRDAELRSLIAELEEETTRFAAPMQAHLLKEVHFASANVARSRDIMGRACRSR